MMTPLVLLASTNNTGSTLSLSLAIPVFKFISNNKESNLEMRLFKSSLLVDNTIGTSETLRCLYLPSSIVSV